MIRFPCVHCGSRLKVSANRAARLSVCPKCGTSIYVPQPGAEFVRKRCGECGSEADAHHAGACEACGAGAEEFHYWCTLHRSLISEVVCPDCLRAFNEQSVPARPEPEPSEPVLAEIVAAPPATVGERPLPAKPMPGPYESSSPKIVERPRTAADNKGLATTAMACGILALASSLFCSCLGILAGGVALGLAAAAYNQIQTGTLPQSRMTHVLVGAICAGLGLCINLSVVLIGVFRYLLGT